MVHAVSGSFGDIEEMYIYKSFEKSLEICMNLKKNVIDLKTAQILNRNFINLL